MSTSCQRKSAKRYSKKKTRAQKALAKYLEDHNHNTSMIC